MHGIIKQVAVPVTLNACLCFFQSFRHGSVLVLVYAGSLSLRICVAVPCAGLADPCCRAGAKYRHPRQSHPVETQGQVGKLSMSIMVLQPICSFDVSHYFISLYTTMNYICMQYVLAL